MSKILSHHLLLFVLYLLVELILKLFNKLLLKDVILGINTGAAICFLKYATIKKSLNFYKMVKTVKTCFIA